jgi:hypothetical protein
MAYKQFNFNDKIRKIPQKTLSREHLTWEDVMMIKLQVINPEYSGVLAYPYKYLPVMSVVDELIHGGTEGIVIPKGTIVSLLTNQTTIASGIPNPTSSGTIPWYIDAIDGDLITSPIDDAYFGYPEGVNALIVPCNGGDASTYHYSTDDDTVEGWTTSTTTDLTIAANIPMGIVMQDIYQDIRGKYINYQTHDATTTIIEGRLTIPFVDTTKLSTFGSDADVASETTSGYTSVWKKWQFFYFAGESGAGRSGAFVKSDMYGKFELQSGAVDATKNIQTVGRVVAYDCRYPRDLSNMIQNYPGITALGKVTEGVPVDLYVFAQTVLAACGLPTTAANILQRIQDGMFGFVTIQLIKG